MVLGGLTPEHVTFYRDHCIKVSVHKNEVLEFAFPCMKVHLYKKGFSFFTQSIVVPVCNA